MNESIAIGRLLRANTTGCVIGCQVNQANSPEFGDMVRVPLADGTMIYGLVYEIFIDDDGLVRQLITAPGVSDEVIADNRSNRNVPIEMSVAFIGWERDGLISQSRVPRPPLTLDEIFTCNQDEIRRFIGQGNFAYLRPLLRNPLLPAADLVAAHFRKLLACTDEPAIEPALKEVIALLKDDYPQLMDVLTAVSVNQKP